MHVDGHSQIGDLQSYGKIPVVSCRRCETACGTWIIFLGTPLSLAMAYDMCSAQGNMLETIKSVVYGKARSSSEIRRGNGDYGGTIGSCIHVRVMVFVIA